MAMVKNKALRTDRNELIRQKEKIANNHLLVQTLDALNIFVIILNNQREIIFMNLELCQTLQTKCEDVIGSKPGELLRCKYSKRSDLGCGYANECALCEVKNIIVDVIHSSHQIKKNVSIVSEIQGIEVTSSFEQSASQIYVDGEAYYLIAFVDRSSDVNRSNLEKIFYHDILNSATSVYNVIRLLKMENDKFKEDQDIDYIQAYIYNIIEEIKFQRSISFAEKNGLYIEYQKIDIIKMIMDTIAAFKADQRFNHIEIKYLQADQPMMIISEPVLIRRIYTNLLKNALEAKQNHSTITVYFEENQKGPIICIHNEEVIPSHIQRFIFEKGYSSKAQGRGFGTYGSKLLLEKYLNGQLTFESNKKKGTIFKMRLPWKVQNQSFHS